jgi:CTP:molybdopterin cytidylyltransferase MocA
MSADIAAIILAAGLSSRMGDFKPLLPLGRATVLERVVNLFKQAGVSDIRVVVGHRAEELWPLLEGWGIRGVANPAYGEGMFTSVRAGVASLEPGVAAFFMHPVDIPLVSPATVQALCQVRGQAGEQILYPTFQGRRGHPPLISISLAAAITSWPGEGGLKALLRRYEGQAREIAVPDEFILRDMDHPGEYARLARAWELLANEPPATGKV